MNERDEAGFTIIELIVALALLLVALTMFSGALVVSEQSAGRQMEQGQTLNQLRLAITTLDAELRSGFVSSVASNHLTATIYTEIRGVPECVGWRLAPATPPTAPLGAAGRQTLYRASWSPGSAAPGNGSDAWRPVVSGIRNGQLGKNTSTFVQSTRTLVVGSPAVTAGESLGLEFWLLTRNEDSLAAVERGATRVATTLTARNVALAALKNEAGLLIATSCGA